MGLNNAPDAGGQFAQNGGVDPVVAGKRANLAATPEENMGVAILKIASGRDDFLTTDPKKKLYFQRSLEPLLSVPHVLYMTDKDGKDPLRNAVDGERFDIAAKLIEVSTQADLQRKTGKGEDFDAPGDANKRTRRGTISEALVHKIKHTQSSVNPQPKKVDALKSLLQQVDAKLAAPAKPGVKVDGASLRRAQALTT